MTSRVGLLTVWFAAAGWVQRRSPLDAHRFVRPWTHYVFWVPFARDWLPPDKEEDIQYGGNAGGHVVRLLVAALVVTFFVSPVWFLNFIVPVGVDTSWARYDAAFQRGLLAPLIALMGGAPRAVRVRGGQPALARSQRAAAFRPLSPAHRRADLGAARLGHFCRADDRRPLQGMAIDLRAREQHRARRLHAPWVHSHSHTHSLLPGAPR